MTFHRHLSAWLFLALFAPVVAKAETPVLLSRAAELWMGERDNWAFTQHVREYDGGKVREERTERYDPSRPGASRWELLAVDGRPPTEERRAEWQKRKTKKRKNPGKSLHDYLDFEHASVARDSAVRVTYLVPLRNTNSWLFPVDKVQLRVTINKASQAIEDVSASIDEPFRVALGLARVMNVDLDVQMNPTPPPDSMEPAAAKPEGTAKVVVNKLGERVEYAWSDFKRVKPHPDNVIPSTTVPVAASVE